MSLSVARREAHVPQCSDGTCGAPAAVAQVATPRTPLLQAAENVFTAAYAAGSIGGLVVAVGSLAAIGGLLATGIYDHSHATHFSDVFTNNWDLAEKMMKGGTIFIGACATVMVGTLGVFGASALAARFRRATA